MNLETAKKLKKELTQGFPSKIFNARPIDREFYGRWELALELLSSLEDIKTIQGVTSANILTSLEMTLQVTLDVYGKNLQENTNIDQAPPVKSN